MKKLATILLSLIMAFTMMPTAFADTTYAESSIPEIDYGTPGEDYEPGQVIVCVEGGEDALIKTGFFSKKVDGAKVTIDETLMEFDTAESNVDKAAAISEGDKQALTEAINDDASQKEKYSFVLINSNKKDITSLIEKLKELDCVKFAEPNVICEPSDYDIGDATGEPAFDYQWYLDKKATNVEFDIDAEKAYESENFSKQNDVVVAVMDTGVDYKHPDLRKSMWTSSKQFQEIVGGGDCGINTVPGEVSTDPMDTEIGHGTHCASTIASTWDNKEGIAGINGNVKIMACKWMSAAGGYISNYISAMQYVCLAKMSGVNIVATNNSWGPSTSLEYCGGVTELMTNLAGEMGIVSCFAAGNSEYDHDKYTNFVYDSPYIITVGAMQSNGKPADFSERGAHTVDVFAPGTQILAATSTYDNSNMLMAPQYLPWIQASADSKFYEDFNDEDDQVTFEAYLSENTENSVLKSQEKRNGYADEKAVSLKLDSLKLAKDSILNIEIDIKKDALSDVHDLQKYYFALAAGIEDLEVVDVYYGGANLNIANMEYYNGSKWKPFGVYDNKEKETYPINWMGRDVNWSICTGNFDSNYWDEVFDQMGKSEVAKLRLTSKIKSVGNNPEFHIDNIGIGNKTSNYYYSDGTSMATPCTAGVVSLVAGAMGNIDTSADALEVIARVKGGVQKTGGLDNECITQGCVQATAAFATDSELNPVPNSVTISGDSATIKGYFFGDNKGSVKIGNYTADVTSWNKNSITVIVPTDVKYRSYEYIVTRDDGKSGRNFGVFRKDQSAEGFAYKEIEIADIEYGGVETEDLLPVRIAANDDGILALLGDEDNSDNKLQFYSSADGKWTDIKLPESKYIIGRDEIYSSIVGSGHNFYLLITDNFNLLEIPFGIIRGTSRIVSYTTTASTCKQTSNISFSNACSALAIGNNGELFMALGTRNNTSSIGKLNPATGRVTTASDMGKLPSVYKENFAVAGSFLISGSTQMIVGAQLLLERYSESELFEADPGAPSLKAAYRTDNGEWKMVNASILDEVDGGRKYEQNELAAYGATNQGYIMAGPAKNIGQDNMIDTWSYNASSDSFEALSARVDPERLRAQAGVSYGGRFYVMGNSRSRGNKLFLKYLELEQFGLSMSNPPEIPSGGGGGTGGGGGGGQIEPETKTTDAEPVVSYDSEGSGLNVAIEGLTEGKDYKVELPEDGDKVGTHTAEIVFMGAYSKMEKKTVTYVVLPKGTEINKISGKKKSMIVKFDKQTSQTTGYQIRYSLNSSMKSAKSITIKKNTTTKKTIKKLKSKKKYYVQTRTYTKVKEGKSYKNYYSVWSKAKSVKVK